MTKYFTTRISRPEEKRKRQAPQKPEFTEQKPDEKEVSGENRDGNAAEAVVKEIDS